MTRPLLAALALAASVALAGCSSPCRDLGDRLCRCTAAGTTRDTCERQVQQDLDRIGTSDDQEKYCDGKLATCEAPSGADFCEWLDTSCGKALCGLSLEEPAEACP